MKVKVIKHKKPDVIPSPNAEDEGDINDICQCLEIVEVEMTEEEYNKRKEEF